MQRKPVVSSNIRSIGFENGAMEIEFANQRVYRYTGPKVREHYDGLIAATSPGKYFAASVRTCPETKCELFGDTKANE
jgi:hypothetical protein